jgi:hypothetical protein
MSARGLGLFGQRDIGRRQCERDEDRGYVSAFCAVARLVVVVATATLHGHGVVVAEVLHLELRFDAGGIDVRRAEQSTNGSADRLATRTRADWLGGKSWLGCQPGAQRKRE